MRDVLDYTEQELRDLDVDSLKRLLNESQMLESLYETKQLVNKRLMNALYGALGNAAFPLFNEHMAAAITGNGRFFIRTLSNFFEKELQRLKPKETPYVIYNDTDSCYYTIAPFVDDYKRKNPNLSINEYVDWANSFETKVMQPIIVAAIDDFAKKLNAYSKKSIWAEREIISDSTVFVAKKKYFARVRDSEGTRYPENDPYIKVMGLELIKSSTPKWSQKKLKEAIPLFLDKSESQAREWLNETKKHFLESNVLDLASVSGVSSIDYKLTDSGVPIGSRAAIVHNNYIIENNLTGKYETIKSGEKTKRLFLKKGNPFNSNIVAFTNDQFADEVKNYVDYDEIFLKNFLSPLEIMAKALKWNLTKETENLEDW
jgi:DNA polymerase family B